MADLLDIEARLRELESVPDDDAPRAAARASLDAIGKRLDLLEGVTEDSLRDIVSYRDPGGGWLKINERNQWKRGVGEMVPKFNETEEIKNRQYEPNQWVEAGLGAVQGLGKVGFGVGNVVLPWATGTPPSYYKPETGTGQAADYATQAAGLLVPGAPVREAMVGVGRAVGKIPTAARWSAEALGFAATQAPANVVGMMQEGSGPVEAAKQELATIPEQVAMGVAVPAAFKGAGALTSWIARKLAASRLGITIEELMARIRRGEPQAVQVEMQAEAQVQANPEAAAAATAEPQPQAQPQPPPQAQRPAAPVRDTHLYDILGLTPDATPEQINTAARNYMFLHHPDRGGDVNSFRQFSQARDILTDPAARAAYDSGGMAAVQRATHQGTRDAAMQALRNEAERLGIRHEGMNRMDLGQAVRNAQRAEAAAKLRTVEQKISDLEREAATAPPPVAQPAPPDTMGAEAPRPAPTIGPGEPLPLEARHGQVEVQTPRPQQQPQEQAGHFPRGENARPGEPLPPQDGGQVASPTTPRAAPSLAPEAARPTADELPRSGIVDEAAIPGGNRINEEFSALDRLRRGDVPSNPTQTEAYTFLTGARSPEEFEQYARTMGVEIVSSHPHQLTTGAEAVNYTVKVIGEDGKPRWWLIGDYGPPDPYKVSAGKAHPNRFVLTHSSANPMGPVRPPAPEPARPTDLVPPAVRERLRRQSPVAEPAPLAPKAEAPAPAEGKQPWEMTRAEWMKQRPSGTSPGMHSWEVQKAIREGKIQSHPDYPDLAPNNALAAKPEPAAKGEEAKPTLVDRLKAYEKEFQETFEKNPNATEDLAHNNAMVVSGLTGDGLRTARNDAGLYNTSKPGLVVVVDEAKAARAGIRGLGREEAKTTKTEPDAKAKDDASVFADAVQRHSAEPDTNGYNIVLKSLGEVLENKGFKPTGENKSMMWELSNRFHDPLASSTGKESLEQLGKMMDYRVIELGREPHAVQELNRATQSGYWGGSDIRKQLSRLESDMQGAPGTLKSKLDKALSEAEHFRRKADLVESLIGPTERTTKAREVADQIEQRARGIEQSKNDELARLREEVADEPYARFEELKDFGEVKASVVQAFEKNIAEADSKWISDGRMLIKADAVKMADQLSLRRRVPDGPKRIDDKRIEPVWKDAVKKADKPAEILGVRTVTGGRDSWKAAYLQSGDTQVGVDAQKLAYLKRITGADSIRLSDEKGPSVLYKGKKPVAVLMPLDVSGQPVKPRPGKTPVPAEPVSMQGEAPAAEPPKPDVAEPATTEAVPGPREQTTGQKIMSGLSSGSEPPEVVGLVSGLSDTAGKIWRSVRGALGDVSGQTLPRVTASSRQAGEVGAEMAASPRAAKFIADDFTGQVLTGGVDKNKLGAVLVEDRLRAIRDGHLAAGDAQAAGRVKTLIGGPNSPFATEADYRAALADPKIQQAIATHKRLVQPYTEKLYTDIDPAAQLAGPGKDTGAFVNLKAVQPGTPGSATVAGSGTGPQRWFPKKSPFARKATGAANAYDIDYSRVIENSIGRQLETANQHRFYEALQAAGDAVRVPAGQKVPYPLPELKGEGTKEVTNRAGWKMLVRESLYPEISRALNTETNPYGDVAAVKGLEWLNKIALVGPMDGIWHTANILRVLSNRPGIGAGKVREAIAATGGAGDLAVMAERMVSKAVQMIRQSPAVKKQLAELASINAMGKSPRPLSAKPWSWMGAAITQVDTAARLVLDDAYKFLVSKGLAVDTPTARREFVNQVGNYNLRTQPAITRFLRQSQLGPFVTAGKTMATNYARSATLSPGVKAQSLGGAAVLRALVLSRILGTLGTIAIVNHLTTGKPAGRSGTPLGSIDTGKSDERGRPITYPLAQLMGYTGAFRLTGLRGFLETRRSGGTTTDAIDQGIRESVSVLIHPAAGPPVRAIANLFGTDVRDLGRQTTPRAPEGKSQWMANAREALNQIQQFGQMAATAVPSLRREGDTGTDSAIRMLPFAPVPGRIPARAERSGEALMYARIAEYGDFIIREVRKVPRDQRVALYKRLLNEARPQDRGRLHEMLKGRLKFAVGRE